MMAMRMVLKLVCAKIGNNLVVSDGLGVKGFGLLVSCNLMLFVFSHALSIHYPYTIHIVSTVYLDLFFCFSGVCFDTASNLLRLLFDGCSMWLRCYSTEQLPKQYRRRFEAGSTKVGFKPVFTQKRIKRLEKMGWWCKGGSVLQSITDW